MMKQAVHALSALALLGAVTSAFAAGEVSLLHTRSNECPPVSGCYASTFFDGAIEVQNLAYSKQVELHYKKNDGSWAVAPAQYVGPSTAGKEFWTVKLPSPSESFAVKYVVNGQTYWDNNGGKNYSAARYRFDANLGYPAISDAQGSYQPASGSTAAHISGNILVKNLNANKTVTVTYTDDNWTTKKTATARFRATLPSGVEYWEYTLPLASSADLAKVKLAFHYNWSSGSAWDNNFGKNYRLVNGLISR